MEVAKVTKAAKQGAQANGSGASGSDDPWASAPPAGNGGYDDEPPF